MNQRFRFQGFDLDKLIQTDQYIPVDANETLSKFMVNDWPDETLFEEYITRLFTRATKDNRKVRAFGELVVILWQEGHNGATVRLEHLWCRLHEKKQFALYFSAWGK